MIVDGNRQHLPMNGYCEVASVQSAATVIDGETASRLRQERLAGSRLYDEAVELPREGRARNSVARNDVQGPDCGADGSVRGVAA